MAGAAGFEPAVPGLGGQCIIQAMLHAHFGDCIHLKNSEGVQIATLTSNLSRENQAMFDVGQAWRVSAASQLPTPRRATGRRNKSRH